MGKRGKKGGKKEEDSFEFQCGWDIFFLGLFGLIIWTTAIVYLRDLYTQYVEPDDVVLVADGSHHAAATQNSFQQQKVDVSVVEAELQDYSGALLGVVEDRNKEIEGTSGGPPKQLSQFRSLPFNLAQVRTAMLEQIETMESEWKIHDPPAERIELFERALPTVGTEYRLSRRLSRKLLLGEPLVLGITGSSNSAGHDNELADAYPSVLRQMLADLLGPFGVPVVLRNAGVGNTKTLPACFCLPTMLSRNPAVYPDDNTTDVTRGQSAIDKDHVDIVVWEWLMNDAGTFPECTVWYEAFVRSAVRDLGAASVLFVHIESGRDKDQRQQQSSGRQPPSVNQHATEPPFNTLRDHYGDYVNLNDLFTRDALWPLDDVAPFRLEDLFGSLHPLPSGHRFIAHMLVRYVLRALELSLADLDTLGAKGRAALAGFVEPNQGAAETSLVGLNRDLLPSNLVQCEAVVCDSTPHCATTISPHGARANASLVDAVIDWGSSSSSSTGSGSAADGGDSSTGSGWQFTLLEGEHLHPERHYLDRKDVLKGTAGSGWLTLNATVHRSPKGIIVLCEPATEWRRPEGVGSLLQDVDLQLDGQPWPLPPQSALTALARGNVFREHCLEITQASTGIHQLQVRVKPTSENHVYLAYLIST